MLDEEQNRDRIEDVRAICKEAVDDRVPSAVAQRLSLSGETPASKDPAVPSEGRQILLDTSRIHRQRLVLLLQSIAQISATARAP
jgi:hypothetical protein